MIYFPTFSGMTRDFSVKFCIHFSFSPCKLYVESIDHLDSTEYKYRLSLYRHLICYSDRSLEDSCGSSINSMSEYFVSQGSCSDTRQGELLCLIVTSVDYKIPHETV